MKRTFGLITILALFMLTVNVYGQANLVPAWSTLKDPSGKTVNSAQSNTNTLSVSGANGVSVTVGTVNGYPTMTVTGSGTGTDNNAIHKTDSISFANISSAYNANGKSIRDLAASSAVYIFDPNAAYLGTATFPISFSAGQLFFVKMSGNIVALVKCTVAKTYTTAITGDEYQAWDNLVNQSGTGPDGMVLLGTGTDSGGSGVAATVAVGSVTTGAAGTQASITNTGTSTNAVFNFTIPKGDKGDQGVPGVPGSAASVSVGTVTTGSVGTNASVTNTGTSSNAVLNFTIPQGPQGSSGPAGPGATVSVGNVTTGLPGTSASVSNTGTANNAVLNFTIPQGATSPVTNFTSTFESGTAEGWSVPDASTMKASTSAAHSGSYGFRISQSQGQAARSATFTIYSNGGLLDFWYRFSSTNTGSVTVNGTVTSLNNGGAGVWNHAVMIAVPSGTATISITADSPTQAAYLDFDDVKMGVGNAALYDVGTTASTVAAGNDTRIVNSEQTGNKGQVNGYASLDSGGKVPNAQLPASPTFTSLTTGSITSTASDGSHFIQPYNSASCPSSCAPASSCEGALCTLADGKTYQNHNGSWSQIGGAATWGSIAGTLANQSDLNSALAAKAPLASPNLTGVPTAPTASANAGTTQIATTAYVDRAVSSVSVPAGNSPAQWMPNPPSIKGTAGNAQNIIVWSSASIDISHDAPTDGTLYYSTDPNFGSGVGAVTVGYTAGNWTHTGLLNGTPYYYRARYSNPIGSSAYSNVISLTPTGAATTYAPDAPTGVTATSGDSYVNLVWNTPATDSSHPATSSYKVYRGTASGAETLLGTVPVNNMTDGTTVNGVTYYYYVKATNSVGDSVASSEVSATPSSGVVVYTPNAPIIGTATAGDSSATVAFTAGAVDSNHSGATSYTATSSPGSLTGTGSASPITVSGLTNGTPYTFTVTASNSAGTSAASAASNSVTPAAAAGSTYTFDGSAGTGAATYNSYFTANTAGSGTANLDGSGGLRIYTPTTTDGAVVYRTAAITPTDTKTYKWRFKSAATTADSGFWFEVVDDTAKRSPGTGESGTARVRAIIGNIDGSPAFDALYINTTPAITSWDSSVNAWGSTDVGYSITANTYYWLTLTTDSTGWQLILRDSADSSTLKALPKVLWSSTRSFSNSVWLRWGDINTNSYISDITIDTFSEQ